MKLPPEELRQRAGRIRLLLIDCDGVLTDGGLYYATDGERVIEAVKVFHIHDGLGLRLARQAGLKVGIISGRGSLSLAARARELEIDYLSQGIETKLEAYEEIRAAAGLQAEEIAYLGDDLPDLPLMRQVGLAIAVEDAVSEVRQSAHFITQRRGGRGAVREAVELILKAQDKWDAVIASFTRP